MVACFACVIRQENSVCLHFCVVSFARKTDEKLRAGVITTLGGVQLLVATYGRWLDPLVLYETSVTSNIKTVMKILVRARCSFSDAYRMQPGFRRVHHARSACS